MKRKGYQTNAEYIESMMKQFKLPNSLQRTARFG